MKHSRVLTAFNPYTTDPFIRFFSAPADTETAGSDSGDQGKDDDSKDSAHGAGDSEQQDDQKDDEELGEGGKKALQSERDARKQLEREIADLRSKNKEYEDATNSAEEKQAERLAELEESSTKNALRILQYEVAADKGLPLSAATRLTGDSKEALEKDADELKKLLGTSTSERPKPDLSQGNGSDKTKPKNLADAVTQHYS